jgi:hypothetical protein
MAIRTFPVLACLVILPASACNRAAAPPAPVAATPVAETEPKTIEPSCAVESAQEIKLDDGTEMRLWNLKASGLKRLTAQLLVATDGKAQTANEVEYKWDKWEPTAPAASGQLVLLIQDGKAFGVKGRRLPLMALDLRDSPSNIRTAKKLALFLEGELHPRITSSSYGTPLGQKNLIYAQLFTPKVVDTGSYSLSSNPESVADASKDGRTVVAVLLEWAAQ